MLDNRFVSDFNSPTLNFKQSKKEITMYGKIFTSIYDGSLSENWQALITFQQMIVLCDADGIINMTPQAMSRRTGIPFEHIKTGIEFLEGDDPESRSSEESGKRIVRLDNHRSWGWFIVNYEYYKSLKDADAIRNQNKLRKRKQREKNNESRNVTQCHTQSRHIDIDIDIDTDIDKKNKKSSPKIFCSERSASPPSEPPVLAIQLIHSGKDGCRETYPISQTDIDEWEKSYPAVDVLQTLRNIREWNLSNPKNNKTRKGIRRHITTWLAREQDKGGNRRKESVSEQILSEKPNPKLALIKSKINPGPKNQTTLAPDPKQNRMFVQFVKRYGKPMKRYQESIALEGCKKLEKIWETFPESYTRCVTAPGNTGKKEFIDLLFDEFVGDDFEQIKYLVPESLKETSVFWRKLRPFLVDQGLLEPTSEEEMKEEEKINKEICQPPKAKALGFVSQKRIPSAG